MVDRVDSGCVFAQRLLDLGFLPGTRVALIRRAPLGDPLCFSIRGGELCLRGTEAAHVWVSRSP